MPDPRTAEAPCASCGLPESRHTPWEHPWRADPRTAEERLHEDDSYGACVICREWVPHTDETFVLVPWPCAVERLRAARKVVAAARAAAWLIATPNPLVVDGQYRGAPLAAVETAYEALRTALLEVPE